MLTRLLVAPACLLCILAVGCIPSEPLEEGQLDQTWTLTPDPTDGSRLADLSMDGSTVPSRWRIVQTSDTAAAEASFEAAQDAVLQGTRDVEVLFSPQQAEQLASVLGMFRETLDELNEIREGREVAGTRQWADQVATQLVRIEALARKAEDGSTDAGEEVAADPVLQAALTYMDRRAQGNLLSGMDLQETGRLRHVVTHITLRVSFAILSKDAPEGLATELAERMQSAESLGGLKSDLAARLRQAAEQAPQASGEGLATMVEGVLEGGPRTLKIMESALKQWDRVEFVNLELRKAGELAFATIEARILPGKEVRMADVVVLQPTLLARGHGRVVIIPVDPVTGEHVVRFESLDDAGGAILKFEGFLWGLAKTLAIPLADGKLREVRAYRHAPSRGVALTYVAMLTEATNTKDDPRRVLIVQDWADRTILRTAFAVEHRSRVTNTVFNYLTPETRYTYQRNKTLDQMEP